jgi:hypothetical protein
MEEYMSIKMVQMGRYKELIWEYIGNSGVELGVIVIVFNATFNNISVISWRSDLLVGETGVLGENK